MLYPAQAVDGVVHLLGGKELRAQLEAVPANGEGDVGQPLRCAVGEAVVTRGCGELNFDLVAHAVPPFWADPSWERLLRRCYSSSLDALAAEAPPSGTAPAALWIASPLVGAGARGAPKREAARVVVSELMRRLAADAEPSAAAEEPPPRAPPPRDLRFRVVVLPGDGQAAFRAVAEAVDAESAQCQAVEARAHCVDGAP